MANPLIDDLKMQYRHGSVAVRLLFINIAVFLLINLVALAGYLSGNSFSDDFLLPYLTLPAQLSSFAAKPWTIITYAFVHTDFFHLLFNMMWLYFGGKMFSEYLGERRLLIIYLLGGIAGGFLYILFFNLLPVFSPLAPVAVAMGASAAVMAIFAAIAAYIPDFSVNLMFFGAIRLKWLAVILIVLDLISIPRGNPGGHLAHIGGALLGFSFTMLLKNGTDITSGPSKLIAAIQNLFRPKPKLKVVYGSGNKRTDDQFNAEKKAKQQKVDAILDKISKNGYDSLTKEEKDFLFKASKET